MNREFIGLTFDELVNVICTFEGCDKDSAKAEDIKEFVQKLFESYKSRRKIKW